MHFEGDQLLDAVLDPQHLVELFGDLLLRQEAVDLFVLVNIDCISRPLLGLLSVVFKAALLVKGKVLLEVTLGLIVVRVLWVQVVARNQLDMLPVHYRVFDVEL